MAGNVPQLSNNPDVRATWAVPVKCILNTAFYKRARGQVILKLHDPTGYTVAGTVLVTTCTCARVEGTCAGGGHD